MKKRLISLMLIVVMLVGMVPALGITVGATDTVESETTETSHILYEENFDDITTRVDLKSGNNTSGETDGWCYYKKSTTGSAYLENGKMYLSGDKYDKLWLLGGENWENYTFEADFCYIVDEMDSDGWGGMCYNLQASNKFQKAGFSTGVASLNGMDGAWTNNAMGVNRINSDISDTVMSGAAVRMKIVAQDNRAVFYYAFLNDDGSMTSEFKLLMSIDNIADDAQTGTIGFMTSSGEKMASFWVDNIKCYSNELTYMLYEEDFDSYTDKVDLEKNATTDGWHYLSNKNAEDSVFIKNGRMYVMGHSYDMLYREYGENWKNYTFEVDFAYILDNGGDSDITQVSNIAANAWSGICYNVKSGTYNNDDGYYFQKLSVASTTGAAVSTKVSVSLNGGLRKNGSAAWINNSSSDNKTNSTAVDHVAIANGSPVRFKIVVDDNTAVAYYAMLNEDGTTKGNYQQLYEISNIPDSCLGGSIGFMTGNTNVTSYWVDNIKCYSNEPAFYSEDFNSYEDTVLEPNTINTELGLWYVQNSATSVAKIENGALYLSGGSTGFTDFDAVFFTMGTRWKDYILEADYTYLKAEATRGYSGLMY